jgi:aminoglycoside phosphotransferase (APT) family kinase protein
MFPERHAGGGCRLRISGVGDPACDLVIARTMFSGDSREAFRAAVGRDVAIWARGRALWRALLVLACSIDTDRELTGA